MKYDDGNLICIHIIAYNKYLCSSKTSFFSMNMIFFNQLLWFYYDFGQKIHFKIKAVTLFLIAFTNKLFENSSGVILNIILASSLYMISVVLSYHRPNHR